MANEAWIERQTRTPAARRRYEQERLILWTTEAVCEAMECEGLNRSEMAERLGTTRAHVTQLLSGSRNMTLRSLASLAHACGMRASISLEELTATVFTRLEEGIVSVRHPGVKMQSASPCPTPALDRESLSFRADWEAANGSLGMAA